MMSLLNSSSLKFSSLFSGSRTLFTATPDYFKITPQLWREPLKKKKRADPAVEKQKLDRRRKNLEKEIRVLKKSADQFKPIDELEVSSVIKNSLELRKRLIPKLSLEEEIRRRRIERRWCQYKNEQHQEDFININKAIKASERALVELKEVSEDLYMEAIQLDLQLLPFRCEGPLRTPPVEGYEATDGDYKDITKKWE
ncbi:UNVERIFIED_CONTAM: hypothetical protein RMT77_005465 [Armadillidium vulgare]